MIDVSRIYVGAHYPGDVVSGSTFGALFAFVIRRILLAMRATLD